MNLARSWMWFSRGSFRSFMCIHMWHVSFICDMTHSYVKSLIHTRHASCIGDKTHSEGGMRFSIGSFHSFMCIHMQHDSFIRNMTYSEGGTWLSRERFHSFMCNHIFYNTLQHTATHCCTPQHCATLCKITYRPLNESCHLCMRHAAYEWVMSYVIAHEWGFQRVAARCSVLYCVALCAVCCSSVLQCVAVCCNSGPHITRALHPTIHMWRDSFHSHDTCMCDMTQSYSTWLNHVWHDNLLLSALKIEAPNKRPPTHRSSHPTRKPPRRGGFLWPTLISHIAHE